jgi:hypothetical protein
MNLKEKLGNLIATFLEERGIDPFYAVTIFCILITLSYWRVFKNWDKVPGWRRRLAGSAAYGAIVLSIFSLLRLVGVIRF